MKREGEHGRFLDLRRERDAGAVLAVALRDEWTQYLLPRTGDAAAAREVRELRDAAHGHHAGIPAYCGMRGCVEAQALLTDALRDAIHRRDWAELWVLLGQIGIWLQMSADPHALTPWWIQMSRAQAGGEGVVEVLDVAAREDPGGADTPLDVDMPLAEQARSEQAPLDVDMQLAGLEVKREEPSSNASQIEEPSLSSDRAFLPNHRVRLCELQTEHLNDACGMVIGPAENGRVPVQLDPPHNSRIRVKPENLRDAAHEMATMITPSVRRLAAKNAANISEGDEYLQLCQQAAQANIDGDVKAAVRLTRQAIKLDPDRGDAHFTLAEAHKISGDDLRANKRYLAAMERCEGAEGSHGAECWARSVAQAWDTARCAAPCGSNDLFCGCALCTELPAKPAWMHSPQALAAIADRVVAAWSEDALPWNMHAAAQYGIADYFTAAQSFKKAAKRFGDDGDDGRRRAALNHASLCLDQLGIGHSRGAHTSLPNMGTCASRKAHLPGTDRRKASPIACQARTCANTYVAHRQQRHRVRPQFAWSFVVVCVTNLCFTFVRFACVVPPVIAYFRYNIGFSPNAKRIMMIPGGANTISPPQAWGEATRFGAQHHARIIPCL